MKRLALGLVGWALLAACAPHKSAAPVATVNGEPISARAYDLELRLARPELDVDGGILEGLIDQALILQEGRRLGVSLNEDALKAAEAFARSGTDDATLAQSLDERGVSLKEWRERVAQGALTDEVVRQAVRNKVDIGRQEIQDYYWEHLPAFRKGERRVLRQIFTALHKDGEAALRELQLGEPFVDVAKRRGQGPEAADGGLLGPEGKTQLPKELATAIKKLKPGQFSPLVHSPWGWHLLYLEEVQKEQGDSLDQAAPKAHARLLRDKEQDLYRLWLTGLREQARIERLIPSPTAVPQKKANAPVKGGH